MENWIIFYKSRIAMKIMISYFYQIRHFSKNMIPISTAMWDPKWYHEFKNSNHIYIDDNHIINGLRFEELHLPEDEYNALENEACVGNPCKYTPDTCTFLKRYYDHLSSLDFDDLMNRFTEISNKVKDYMELSEEPIIVLIVHEAPDNPCSERYPLIRLFKEHNIDLKEFSIE